MSYYDMVKGTTLAFIGEKRVGGKNTNSNLLRYIVNAVVVGNGVKLEPICSFRWTKMQKAPPRWAQQNPQKPCKCYFTKGGSQSTTLMLAWIREILLPYYKSKNQGPNEWRLLIMDSAIGL